MKVAIITDSHCGANNNSEFMIEYQTRFYNEVFFPYLRQHQINHIIHLGDYYDNRKALNVRAISENRKIFLDKLREYEMDMDILVGNHDVYYKNTNKVNSLQELMGSYSNISIIEDPVTTNIMGRDICLIPWINDENRDDALKIIKSSNAEICLGHFEFSGFKMNKNDPYGFRGTEQISKKTFKKFKKVLSGHFHTKSKQGNIEYLGSPFEFTWADLDDPKYFHILDLETLEIEAIRNPLTIYSEIIYRDAIDVKDIDVDRKIIRIIPEEINNEKAYEKFFSYVKEHAYSVTTKLPAKEENAGMEIETVDVMDTPALITQYIENLETDFDKVKLGQLMVDIYKEAQNI